jgi:2'-hydroxyisoflavone reductase
MRLLVLGGSQFVGRHIVEGALARGHTVTLFNRGRTNPGMFPDVEEIHGDRDGGLSALDGRTWDAVIDTSGYLPRVVRQSVEALSGRAGQYVFVSTISVYAQPMAENADESAALATMDDETSEDISAHYGALKVLCERAVDSFDGPTLNVRPGMIVGPYDPTDRFTYWIWRIAQGGEVLAPGNPDRPVQFIDARDLAALLLTQTENGATGAVNATGPDHCVTMRDYLEACQRITASDARLTWIPDDFLLDHDVGVFMEMPFWLPDTDNALFTVNIDRALAAGLTFRPLDETIRDTWVWSQTRDAETPRWSSAFADNPRAVGMNREREKALLKLWHEREK